MDKLLKRGRSKGHAGVSKNLENKEIEREEKKRGSTWGGEEGKEGEEREKEKEKELDQSGNNKMIGRQNRVNRMEKIPQ